MQSVNRSLQLRKLVGRLAQLDTCAVSDALDRLGLGGAAAGFQPMLSAQRIAGRVLTVQLKPRGSELPRRHLGAAAIQAAAPGDVLVVAHSGRLDVSGWGGLLSAAAQARSLAGVIVDGACRDVDEIRRLAFPVFARAATPLSARGRVVEHSWGEPIEFAGVLVRPGDFVLADASGVVFLPQQRAEQVVAEAERIAAWEAERMGELLSGRAVEEVLGTAYEQALEADHGN